MSLCSSPPRYVTRIDQLSHLSEQERAALRQVADRFAFRSNEYYLSLIRWEDPQDPIRRIIVPLLGELDAWGSSDPSNEKAYTVLPGVEHKYRSTVLLLFSNTCEGTCRYCFRKRLFNEPDMEYLRDPSAAMTYLKEHSEITDVLLSGGDPLAVSTPRLADIFRQLHEIEHIRTIRISTKTPAFNPHRILGDPPLVEMFAHYGARRKRLYVMTHFVHPRELAEPAVAAVELLQRTGAIIANQMPLIRGVNDNPDVLARLFTQLASIGDVPYYVFQCRPASGNLPYVVPIEQGCEILEQAKSQVFGLAKRFRFIMSHSTGKIEIIGNAGGRMCFRYHQAVKPSDCGQFLLFRSNRDARWLEDYQADDSGSHGRSDLHAVARRHAPGKEDDDCLTPTAGTHP